MIRATLDRVLSIFRWRSDPAPTESRSLMRLPSDVSVPKANVNELRFHLGWTEENGQREPVYVMESDMATHGTVLGRTGRGKSKLLQLFVRELLANQRGFMVIDPKKRAVLDILADTANHMRKTRCDAILKRVVLIDITPESVPLLSAMHWQGAPLGNDVLARNARIAFQAKEADVLIEIIHQMAGEPQEGAPRIKRLLRDIFVALATLGLEFGDAFVLLDPFHSRHRDVWNVCKGSTLLPEEVLANLGMIHELKRPQDVLTQIEGPLNRLRSLLSPLVRACFTNRLKGLDFARMLRERQIVLVNSSESRFVSQFQAKTIAGFVIHRLIEEAANEDTLQQDRRPPFSLFVDEAAELMGPDIERNLRIGRSLKVPTFLFSQNLSAYKRDDKDFRETVLNEPGLTIAFQSKTTDELLSNVFLQGKRLDFTKATREVDRHDGYDFIALPTISRSITNSLTRSTGGAKSQTNEQTVTEGSGQSSEVGSGTSSEQRIEVGQSEESSNGRSSSSSRSQHWNESREHSTEQGKSQTKGTESSESYGTHEQTSETVGSNRTNQDISGVRESLGRNRTQAVEQVLRLSADGHSFERVSGVRESFDDGRGFERTSSFAMEETSQETTSKTLTDNFTKGKSESESYSSSSRNGVSNQTGTEKGHTQLLDHRRSVSDSLARSSAQSSQRSLRHSVRRDRQIGRTSGGSVSENWGSATGSAEGTTVGLSLSPLPRYRTEIEELPQLKTDIETQRQMFLTDLSTLPVAVCFLRNDANGRTIRVRIRDVDSPFKNRTQYYRTIEALKAKLRQLHGYLQEPDLSPEEEKARLDAFVAQCRQASNTQPSQAEDNHASSSDQKSADEEAFG